MHGFRQHFDEWHVSSLLLDTRVCELHSSRLSFSQHGGLFLVPTRLRTYVSAHAPTRPVGGAAESQTRRRQAPLPRRQRLPGREKRLRAAPVTGGGYPVGDEAEAEIPVQEAKIEGRRGHRDQERRQRRPLLRRRRRYCGIPDWRIDRPRPRRGGWRSPLLSPEC